jgi:PGF-pre-PGF domain-containing protein
MELQRYGLVFIGLLIIALGIMAPVSAATVTIDNSSATALATAVTGASDGDIIILSPGIYFEHDITIDDSITIRADTAAGGSAADTIINATKSGRIFTVNTGKTVAIDNLTLQNGKVSGGIGGAIYADTGSTLTITTSIITDCSAYQGGAIYAYKGILLTIISSHVSNCSVNAQGGAIYSQGTPAAITSSTFSGCTASADGGAILIDADTTITSTTFEHCSATYGGAVATGTTASLTITTSTFTDCSATAGTGGAISSNGDTLIISLSSFTGCRASYGGAIYATGGSSTISASSFTGCQATYGGAIYATGGSFTITITLSTFENCEVTDGAGGAVYIAGDTVTISSSTFTHCTAHYGVSDAYGGALHLGSSSHTTITSSTFTGCTASADGGAIAVTSPSILTITSSTFEDCSAADRGGAMISTGTTIVHFSRFYHNTGSGTLGSALWQNGGTMDAANNWWGTNDGPGDSVRGDPVTSWLVLGITATPDLIPTSGTSAIRTNLTYTNGGVDTSGGSIFVPDDITNMFAVFSGSGSVLPLTDGTTNGVAESTFTSASTGTSTVSARVDDQTVYTPVMVYGTPAVTSVVPATGRVTGGGGTILIGGSGFTGVTTMGANAVMFGSTPALGFQEDSDMQISAIAPPHAVGMVDVTITTPGGTSAVVPADRFTYIENEPPAVPVPILTANDNSDDFPSSTIPPMTVTVNIGGDSKAWQTVVTGTKLTDLIVTGTVQPGSVSNLTAPPGIVYQYISLIPARFTSITNAVIHFTVPQSWLDGSHIDPKSIVLYHQTANGWEALPTTVLSTKDGTVYFSAESTGFSLFAIAGTPAAATPEVTAMTTQGIMSAIVQTPEMAAVAKAPVTTQTTAPPATTQQPAAPSPLLNVILIAAIGILAAGGFMARRWWIRRQNPALFHEED